jgi:hypothetical protein
MPSTCGLEPGSSHGAQVVPFGSVKLAGKEKLRTTV